MRHTESGKGFLNHPGAGLRWPLAVGLGAALEYILDPQTGRRRRRVLLDKAAHFRRVGAASARKAVADAENRLRGAAAEVRARAVEVEQVPDHLLRERVQAHLGHAVSHPRAIDVTVHEGRVTLSGPILASEADGLLRIIRGIPGVHDISDRLERFESPGEVPALQGGRESRGHRLLGQTWTPAYRLAGILSGLPILGYGVRHKGVSGGLAVGLGAGLLARSLTNLPLNKLTGIGADAEVIEVRKHVTFEASPEEVFSHFAKPDNVRDLSSHVLSVAPGRTPSSWEIVTQSLVGWPLHWKIELSDVTSNEQVSWRSANDSPWKMEGTLRLNAAPGGGTVVDLELWYNPPGGVLGELLASFFGASLQHSLSQELPRIQQIFAKEKELEPQRGESRAERPAEASVSATGSQAAKESPQTPQATPEHRPEAGG